MTIAELIKSFIDSSRERIKTPISGAYMIAFLLYNWRPLSIYLFADLGMQAKIEEINERYCGWDAVLVPLAVAAIYTALVPYIMMTMEIITVKAAKRRISLKADNRNHYLKAQENLIYQEFINEEQRTGKRNQEQITAEISGYKERIENLNQQIHDNEVFYKSEQLKHENTIQDLRKKIEDNTAHLSVDEAQKRIFNNIRMSLSDDARKNFVVASILADKGNYDGASTLLQKSFEELKAFGFVTIDNNLALITSSGEEFARYINGK